MDEIHLLPALVLEKGSLTELVYINKRSMDFFPVSFGVPLSSSQNIRIKLQKHFLESIFLPIAISLIFIITN